MLDLINFNGDASCLPHSVFLKYIEDGSFYSWLQLFDKYSHHAAFGMTGMSLLDVISSSDNLSISSINSSPYLHCINRPYSHSLSIRMPSALSDLNILLGIFIYQKSFSSNSSCYLPPEFSLRSSSLQLLYKLHIDKVFHASPSYFSRDQSNPSNDFLRIDLPDGSSVFSFCIHHSATHSYLRTIQLLVPYSPSKLLWRDGESSLLIPDGNRREDYFLSSLDQPFLSPSDFLSSLSHDPFVVEHYPLRSYQPWIGDYSNEWFFEISTNLFQRSLTHTRLDLKFVLLLLMSHSSDLLASVSKEHVSIQLKDIEYPHSISTHTILRDSRTSLAESINWLGNYYLDNLCFPSPDLISRCNHTTRQLFYRLCSHQTALSDLAGSYFDVPVSLSELSSFLFRSLSS